MSSVLSLEASQKIHALIGNYETENYWVKGSILYGYEGDKEIALDSKWSLWSWGKPTYQDVVHGERFYDFSIRALTPESRRMFEEDNKMRKTYFSSIPAPTFAELLRVLTRIANKLKWCFRSSILEDDVPSILASIYMEAKTEEKGMLEIEKCLMAWLK